MGNCISGEVDEARRRSQKIDQELQLAQLQMRKQVKVLLLGSGESGKTTVLKQMMIIHQNGFSDVQRAAYRSVVHKNVLDSIQAVITYMGKAGLVFADTAHRTLAEKVSNYRSEPTEGDNGAHVPTHLPQDIAGAIDSILKDPMMATIINEHLNNFYLMDSAEYFFDHLKRIASPNYIPNNDDILRARQKSVGITEVSFPSKQVLIHMFDVGGQRPERKKWIHCFESVTSIIFCTSLSEYDQVLLEEKSQNRMLESLVLFESIINSRWFLRTSIILFLNKVDIFTKKLSKVPLNRLFPDYVAGDDLAKAIKYILWRFMQKNRNNLNVYPHVTNATNTDNITHVFSAVRETILQNALKDSGIL